MSPGRIRCLAVLALFLPIAASAGSRCDEILHRLGDRLADATCVESTDLTTANAATTPANNSLAGLPAFAFTPVTDRAVIAPDAPNKTPIFKAVPGIQIDARIAKSFKVGQHGRIQGTISAYNLLNANTPLVLNYTYGPSWLTPTSVMQGRFVKFGVQVDY